MCPNYLTLKLCSRFTWFVCFSKAEGTEVLFSVFLAGVLLDIQQHFGVKDSGAGLLQTGKRGFFLAGFCNLPLLRRVLSDFFSYGPWAHWLWNTLLGRCMNMRGFADGQEMRPQNGPKASQPICDNYIQIGIAASSMSENSWETKSRILLLSLLFVVGQKCDVWCPSCALERICWMYSNWEYNGAWKCKTHQDKYLRVRTAGQAFRQAITAFMELMD